MTEKGSEDQMAMDVSKWAKVAAVVLILGGFSFWLGTNFIGSGDGTGTQTNQDTNQNQNLGQTGTGSGTGTGDKTTVIIQQQTSGQTGAIPIESLTLLTKDKYTQANVAAGGAEFQFWTPKADVSDPNKRYVDKAEVGSAGKATTTASVLQLNVAYDLWFNGSTTYYDEKIRDWSINYNSETGKGSVVFDSGKSFYEAVNFGTAVDVDALPEGTNTSTDDTKVLQDIGTDSINYDESAGTGSGTFKMDIGNSEANSEVWDMVLCLRDNDGDMDNDELTGLTSTFTSGSTKINVPGSLIGYWTDAMGSSGKRCIVVADKIGSSEKARYEFVMTVSEANWDAGEEFEITQDDNGDFSKRMYPSKDLKYVAESLTIGNQA